MNKRLFSLRDFLIDYFKLPICNTKTKCIRYDINKCIGPCRLNTEEKNKEIYKILLDTFGGKDDLIKELQSEMAKESSLLNFEKALEIKDNLELIKSINHKQSAFSLIENNKKLLLWIRINENYYKVYLINGV